MSGTLTPTSRGVTTCRGCGTSSLESVLDLHAQPLANELLTSACVPAAEFPLHLRICTSCGLGQVGEVVTRERIFSDYPYLSSVSSSWVAHARAYARTMYQRLALDARTLVVEVASNDGYLLRSFRELDVPVFGIEPAENVAALARAAGVPTRTAFFGRRTAQDIVDEQGHPALVVANNVMAHVPDLDDFLGGLALLCGPDTLVTVENPSFLTLLRQAQFDTIYHEHFSYLSAHATRQIVHRHGLELVGVEPLATHGGSYRYLLARTGRREVERSAPLTVEAEVHDGLLDPATWGSFARRSRAAITGLRMWVDERLGEGLTLAGYGAAAKGNTLLNAAGITSRELAVVADGSHEKQGKYLPGSAILVVAPERLAASSPTDVLVLPWNLAEEIVPLVGELVPEARCWTAVPDMTLQAC